MTKLRELYEKLTVKMSRLLYSDKGQTTIEYALVVVLIAIALALFFKGTGNSALSVAGSRITSAFQ